MIDPSIPDSLAEKVERELERDERLLWVGMPRAVWFTPVSTAAVLFAIPWTAFALFWILGAAGFQIPDFNGPEGWFPLFGVPFVLVGLAMLSSPYWVRRGARHTVYAITERRAITIEAAWSSTTVRSFPADSLHEVFRREKNDGSGDVIIQRRHWSDSESANQSTDLGFLRIENVREVERMLKQVAEQARRLAI